jgi:hypothetical protein
VSFFPAAIAGAFRGAVFGDFELDGWQVVNLSYFVVGRLSDGTIEKSVTTSRAGLVGSKSVEFDVVRVACFFQCGAGVTFLSSRLFAALFAQAFRLGWIGEVAFVGGRWLAARTAVTLKLGYAGFKLLQGFQPVKQLKNQICNRLGIRLGQGDEFFPSQTLHGYSYDSKMLKLS